MSEALTVKLISRKQIIGLNYDIFPAKKCEKMHAVLNCIFVSPDVEIKCAMLFPLILNSKQKALENSPQISWYWALEVYKLMFEW